MSSDDFVKADVPVETNEPENAEEPETPLSEIDEPVVAAPRPMPRIKLKMPKKNSDEPADTEDSKVAIDSETETNQPAIESGCALAIRPRRTASQPQPPAAARPVRSNNRARAAAKPEPAAPVTRALRSRRGNRTEEEIQREREKTEAIRAALESGDEEEGIEESL